MPSFAPNAIVIWLPVADKCQKTLVGGRWLYILCQFLYFWFILSCNCRWFILSLLTYTSSSLAIGPLYCHAESVCVCVRVTCMPHSNLLILSLPNIHYLARRPMQWHPQQDDGAVCLKLRPSAHIHTLDTHTHTHTLYQSTVYSGFGCWATDTKPAKDAGPIQRRCDTVT